MLCEDFVCLSLVTSLQGTTAFTTCPPTPSPPSTPIAAAAPDDDDNHPPLLPVRLPRLAANPAPVPPRARVPFEITLVRAHSPLRTHSKCLQVLSTV